MREIAMAEQPDNPEEADRQQGPAGDGTPKTESDGDAAAKAQADARAKAKIDDEARARIFAEMKKEARPAWQALLVLTAICTGLLALFGAGSKSWAVAWIELLLGATALSAGAFFGFLFGIPRSLPDDPANSMYRPSTNLEQVSDWLTKILIGVGLVQLAAIRDGLDTIGTLVSKTVTPAPDGVAFVSQLVVVVFLVMGFLSSFLWTRLYYGRIQTLTDRSLVGDMERFKREVERNQEETKRKQEQIQQETKKSLTALAKRDLPASGQAKPSEIAPEDHGLIAEGDASAQLPKEIQDKIDEFMRLPDDDWDSDPTADLFPDAPREDNGRRLDAEMVSNLGEGLLVKLKVVRTGGAPLKAMVIFLLHPTFAQRIVRVLPHNGVAETNFYASGAFTVVAIADEGKTILGYDLAKLPGAPRWFREN
jgi:hypothetical protein